MPDYQVSWTFRSTDGGETTKSFTGTFADFATADAKADLLLADLQAATQAHIVSRRLSEVSAIAGAPPGTQSVFVRASATITLVGKINKGNFTLPAPIAAINPSGSSFVDSTEWDALMANFATGEWALSDGDHYESTLGGKVAHYASGETNF